MKKNFLFILLLLIVANCVFALPVTKTEASRVALNFITERMGSGYNVVETKALDSGYTDNYIYVVNLKPSGFVLISADNAAIPIIGYSTQNTWNQSQLPVQLNGMLIGWNDQMHAIVTQKMSADDSINQLWNHYNVNSGRFTANSNFRAVSPLIASTWGQGEYYNALCPEDSPVGCVATALSQIMRFWRYPAVGNGSNSYTSVTYPEYGEQAADFGNTTYNWGGMPNSVNNTNNSVATLCYHAGVAVNMDYKPNASSAFSTDVPFALTNYFRYAESVSLKERSAYSEENWNTLMEGELNNGRPVYYSGAGNVGGHAFILDGYQGTNSFHINWGWNGAYNGYYTLANLNPAGDNYNESQQAVIGIQPGSMGAPALYESFESASFPPNGWTVTNNSFARASTFSIAGSYSARYNNTGQGSPQSGKKLRTTKVVVDATSPDLSFKARAGSRTEDEQLKVGYSTSESGPYTYFTTKATLSNRAQTFTYSINDLTPGEYYFVFETYCSSNRRVNRSWIIDEVTGPLLWINPLPTPALNIRSWAAGSFAPGDAAYSGNIFQISNTTGGELTIVSVTDLSDAEFKTNLDLDISLVAGQVHEFGFSYEPLDYGTDNQAFVISTNGGDITINLSGSSLSSVFTDSFESYADFATSFSPWTTFNGDEGTPGGVNGIVFPNSTTFTDWIIFNPANTNPPIGNAAPHSGEKYAMAVYNNEETLNDDWMITPALALEGSPTISFWARSYGSGYPETFKVYYSTTNNTAPDSFTHLVTKTNVSTTWTKYTYSLPAACANQPVVYLAIVHASENKFMLFIDDVLVTDDSPLDTPQFGNINGYVYRSGTTTPIEGALVSAGTKITYSDANGFYHLNNILAGTHSITVNADDQFYFSAVEDDVVVTADNTTSQNLYLTWAEIMVNHESITSNLLLGQTEDINLTISNPGGTADLNYELYLTTSTRGNNRINNQFSKKPLLGADVKRITDLNFHHQSDRDEGWMGYTDFDDATAYYNATTNNREKAIKFSVDDFGIWANGVTISKLRALFYNPGGGEEWGASANFYFKIYDSTGTGEALYTSRTYTANSLVTMEDILPTPLVMTTDFWVSVYCTNSFGKPHLVGSSYNNGHSYMGANSGAWAPVAGFDWFIDAYTTGDEWIKAGSYSGTVAPGASVDTNMHFDTTNLGVGTKSAYMYIFNNSNHNANRTNHLMIPITLNVTGSVDLTIPENLVIAKTEGILSIAWDSATAANSYNVYGCNTPDGVFNLIGSVVDPYIELTDVELATFGLDNRAFFYVKADTAPYNPSKVITQRKQVNRNFVNPAKHPKNKGWNRK